MMSLVSLNGRLWALEIRVHCPELWVRLETPPALDGSKDRDGASAGWERRGNQLCSDLQS